jgi:hypothetical protein
MRTLRLAIRRLEARLCDVSRLTDEQLERLATAGDLDLSGLTDAQLERIACGEHPEHVLNSEQLADCRTRAQERAAECA